MGVSNMASSGLEVTIEKRLVKHNPRAGLVWFWGDTIACFQALLISSAPSAIALAISQSGRTSAEQCFAPRNKLPRRYCDY